MAQPDDRHGAGDTDKRVRCHPPTPRSHSTGGLDHDSGDRSGCVSHYKSRPPRRSPLGKGRTSDQERLGDQE